MGAESSVNLVFQEDNLQICIYIGFKTCIVLNLQFYVKDFISRKKS